jgi:hypothetical protein
MKTIATGVILSILWHLPPLRCTAGFAPAKGVVRELNRKGARIPSSSGQDRAALPQPLSRTRFHQSRQMALYLDGAGDASRY